MTAGLGLDAEAVDGLTALAERVARAAGDRIRAGAAPEVESTKSSPTDVVTAMDREVEEQLRSQLAAARPEDGLLGEEGAGLTAGSSGLTWVLDPIDGTVNYLYGIPAYAVSVAAVTGDPRVTGGWTPVAGCVHQPATGQTWTAGAGRGAREDGRQLRLGAPPDPAGALVATGFGYREARRRSQARVVAQLLPQVRDVRRIGSAALDLCSVAAGRVDAYYERGVNVWDVAAGILVVTEAGGAVRGLDGGPPGVPGERTLVAAAPPLDDRLAALLRAADSDAEGG